MMILAEDAFSRMQPRHVHSCSGCHLDPFFLPGPPFFRSFRRMSAASTSPAATTAARTTSPVPMSAAPFTLAATKMLVGPSAPPITATDAWLERIHTPEASRISPVAAASPARMTILFSTSDSPPFVRITSLLDRVD